jgi:hypothetical protein
MSIYLYGPTVSPAKFEPGSTSATATVTQTVTEAVFSDNAANPNPSEPTDGSFPFSISDAITTILEFLSKRWVIGAFIGFLFLFLVVKELTILQDWYFERDWLGRKEKNAVGTHLHKEKLNMLTEMQAAEKTAERKTQASDKTAEREHEVKLKGMDKEKLNMLMEMQAAENKAEREHEVKLKELDWENTLKFTDEDSERAFRLNQAN